MEGQEGHEWHEGHEGQEGQEGHVHKLEFRLFFYGFMEAQKRQIESCQPASSKSLFSHFPTSRFQTAEMNTKLEE